MKNIRTCLILSFSLFQGICLGQQQNYFSISGELKNVKDSIVRIILDYSVNGQQIIDTAEVQNGKYHFEGYINEITRAVIFPNYAKGVNKTMHLMSIYLQSGKTSIVSTGEFKKLYYTGTKAADAINALDKLKIKEIAMVDSIAEMSMEAMKKGEKVVVAKYDSIVRDLRKIMFAKNLSYLKKNRNSPIAIPLLLLHTTRVQDYNITEVESIFNDLPVSMRQTYTAQQVQENINKRKNLSVGSMAPEFIQPDTLGNIVKLSSYRGKYVLLDFWASWCVPCRQENPNLIKAFNKYQDKPFTIIGIALEMPGDKTNWLKAIRNDGLKWTQLSDLKYWDNSVAKQYNIQAIPKNFLIDPSGKIIASDLRGNILEQTLSKIFLNISGF